MPITTFIHGSKGIIVDKLMYISNDDAQNNPFCRLQLVVETFGHLTKSRNQSKFNKSPKG